MQALNLPFGEAPGPGTGSDLKAERLSYGSGVIVWNGRGNGLILSGVNTTP